MAARGTRKVLRVGLLNPVRTLDPRDDQDVVSALVQAQIFETPFAPPIGDALPEPLLFQGPLEAEPPRNGRPAYSAEIRPNLEFSDGTPLTAAKMAESLCAAESLTEQASVEANGNRVRFLLSRPNPRFDLVLTNGYCSIVHLEAGRCLGTGAYMAAPGATPEVMRLVRNPHFRRPTAIDEVEFLYYPSSRDGRPVRLIAAVESGEVHLADCLSRDDVANLGGVRKWHQPGSSTAILFFNTERPYLADSRVRQALALALDRRELTRLSYEEPLPFIATSVLPPFMAAGSSDRLHRDLARARELLSEAGATLPSRLGLMLPWGPRPYLPNPWKIATALGSQLGELGVTLKPTASSDSKDFYNRVADSDYDMALVGWIADTADASDFLEALLSSRQIPERGKSPAIRANMSRWRDVETDAALEAHRQEPSQANRDAVLELVTEKLPFVPLMYGSMIVVHSWGLKNLTVSPISFPVIANLDLDG